jgi:serine/threonine protein kinase
MIWVNFRIYYQVYNKFNLTRSLAYFIVHNDLSPRNVMFFQEDDGTERWKLIDFDAACPVDSIVNVQFITNYSAPEVLRAHKNKAKIRASFATDIFSFGLILYYIETGIFFKKKLICFLRKCCIVKFAKL